MKILLVDDSATVRVTYARLLKGEGHEVMTATTSPDALRTARQSPPDLAIVDFHLGGHSGDELIYELHRDPRTMHILVVMLSSDSDALPLALEAGAIDLITKDEHPEIFLKRIAAICRAIQCQRALTQQLIDLLNKVTDALDVGVLLVDGRSAHPFNQTMHDLVNRHGGLARFTGAREPPGPGDRTRLDIREVPIDEGERLLLVRELAT